MLKTRGGEGVAFNIEIWKTLGSATAGLLKASPPAEEYSRYY
jgi:hypothetical protein